MVTQDNKTCLPYKFDGFLHAKIYDFPETGPILAVGRSVLSLPGKSLKMLTSRMFTVDGVAAACFVTSGLWEFIIIGENGEINYELAEYPKFNYAKINGQLLKYDNDTYTWGPMLAIVKLG